jgi:fructoselysine 6-kinase
MRIAAVGDNCMDVYSALGKAYPGGNPVNVAVISLRLGEQASYTGVVGDDAYGQEMRSVLAAKGVDISHLHTHPGSTAVTMVDLVDGERIFGDYYEGVMADFKLSPEDVQFLLGHDLIHTGIWGKIEGSLPELRGRGPILSFDFADKLDHEIVAQALPFVDYAFFSHTGDDALIREYLIKAQASGPRAAVATLGEHGSIAFDGHGFTSFGIIPVEVVDTMGAGDSFIAGFLRGVAHGWDLPNCLRLGAESASETLKYMGAWPVAPEARSA